MSAERSGPAICNVSNIGEGKDEMTKASIDLQDLRRRIYVKAKAEPSWRFWGLYVHVCKMETLRAAYEMAKRNDGAPGIDGSPSRRSRRKAWRLADDLVILIDAYKRHDWLVGAVDKRLREEFGKLQVEINDEKSRTVDLERGECFGFLGFEFRYLRGLSGAMRPHYTPKLKKRTALVRALKEVFGRHRSQPIERVIALINPVLRGWVNYFAVGHSSECFSFIKDWVEKKVRRHLAHAQKRKGFDWERWNRRWLYDTLGLFNAYRVRRDGPKVAPAG